MISLYITGLVVGFGLGLMFSGIGLIIYLEHFNK
jgi:hypothetical protein